MIRPPIILPIISTLKSPTSAAFPRVRHRTRALGKKSRTQSCVRLHRCYPVVHLFERLHFPGNDFFCNFDDGTICNVIQETDDNFDWSLTDKVTTTLNTGPDKDHTEDNDRSKTEILEIPSQLSVLPQTNKPSPCLIPFRNRNFVFVSRFLHLH